MQPPARVNKMECAACGKDSGVLSACGGCTSVAYCNTECQARDWTDGHDALCMVGARGKQTLRGKKSTKKLATAHVPLAARAARPSMLLNTFLANPDMAREWLHSLGYDGYTQRYAEASERGDDFFVAMSSVANHAGLGLYALKKWRKGRRKLVDLDFFYPGETKSHTSVEMLNQALADAASGHAPGDVDRLARVWNITIHGNGDVNWAALYDTFIAYRFNDWYWAHYDTDGHIVANIDDRMHQALYMNEAPVQRQFINRITFRVQTSTANVKALIHPDTSISFYATRDIFVGDELVLDYGPNYKRTYETPNSEDGVFIHQDVCQDEFASLLGVALARL